MKNDIYNIIKNSGNISFDELFSQSSDITQSKQDLGKTLKELEKEKLVLFYNSNYYDLTKYPDISGVVQWNLNGFCWLAQEDNANKFGIAFDTSDDLVSIFNKRDAFYSDKVKGKLITIEDKSFMYVIESESVRPILVVSSYNADLKKWIVINGNYTFFFDNQLTDVKDGDYAVFEYHTKELVNKIGNKADKGIESSIVKLLSDIKTAPQADFVNTKNTKATKLTLPFYTIDSIYTSDVDDAIHIEETENGYELHVAIADVSSYVKPGDKQDKHALEASTSFYLPHETIHMLDRKLAEDFCSLNVGEEKSSLVCKMNFNKEGQLVNKDFFEANIQIHSRLSYDDVDRIIHNENPIESFVNQHNKATPLTNMQQEKELLKSLKALEKFSILKEQIQEEKWIVDSPEYVLNEEGKVDHLYIKDESQRSQKMVESAMLSANISAAQFLHEKYPEFGLFRNQTVPLELDKPKPAFYDFENAGHWGLKTDFYTHFTSPIRRYCDLTVHRLIKNIISEEPKLYSNEELEVIADKINIQQYKAKQVSIKAKNILIAQYLETLYNNKTFDPKLNIVDYSENGLLCRNSQLIDIYVPVFKLESYVTRVLDKLFLTHGENPSVEQKTEGVKTLNNTWDLYMQFGSYAWTDEKKNIFYQFQKKQPKNKI